MTPFDATHTAFMAEALALAERGRFTTDPNPRVGCVVVKDGRIVGRGYHRVAGQPHAEVYALKEAGTQARGATLYVTLEPCSHVGRTPPCAQAVIESGVAQVVIAMQDPNPLVAGNGIRALEAAGINTLIGPLESEARALNQGFVSRMTHQRPWVRCKMAMSVDGRTAMASGESQWITGPEARRRVHEIRGQVSAIVTGIGTLLADNPAMTVRPDAEQKQALPELGTRQPLRVVIDSQLRTPPDANIFEQAGKVVIVTAADLNLPALQAQKDALSDKAQILCLPSSQTQVDLKQLIVWLGDQGCNEVLIEAGPTLAGAFMDLELVDHLDLFMAPCLLGASAQSLFGFTRTLMKDKLHLDIVEIAPIGKDWHITARPQYSPSQP